MGSGLMGSFGDLLLRLAQEGSGVLGLRFSGYSLGLGGCEKSAVSQSGLSGCAYQHWEEDRIHPVSSELPRLTFDGLMRG